MARKLAVLNNGRKENSKPQGRFIPMTVVECPKFFERGNTAAARA